jgi:hypothetical protein
VAVCLVHAHVHLCLQAYWWRTLAETIPRWQQLQQVKVCVWERGASEARQSTMPRGAMRSGQWLCGQLPSKVTD